MVYFRAQWFVFFQRCARMHCTFTPQRAKNGKILQEIYLLPQITKNRSAPKEFEGKTKQLNFILIFWSTKYLLRMTTT